MEDYKNKMIPMKIYILLAYWGILAWEKVPLKIKR